MADEERVADVLIIGAGPTGAVAAKRLAEAGMRVVVLEQGDWPDYSKARADHADFELTAGRDWAANPNRRQAPADRSPSVGEPELPGQQSLAPSFSTLSQGATAKLGPAAISP